MSNQRSQLNERREFYIHRIVRNGKMYDDENKKEIKKVESMDNT